MERPANFNFAEWDDPFWHAVRMALDVTPKNLGRAPDADEILNHLAKKGTPATRALETYLAGDRALVERIADYLEYRWDTALTIRDSRLRTEVEAKKALQQISKKEVATYGTQSKDHHQSSKVMVATVDALTHVEAKPLKLTFDGNPQSRTAIVDKGTIWVSPRRLDGAIPGLLNPTAVWEIKEYWGKTKGGSKMSDAIYEAQLVGEELRAFEALVKRPPVKHYLILDGKEQWGHRMSDLRRAIDLLSMGLIDELICGSEVITRWPAVVKALSR